MLKKIIPILLLVGGLFSCGQGQSVSSDGSSLCHLPSRSARYNPPKSNLEEKNFHQIIPRMYLKKNWEKDLQPIISFIDNKKKNKIEKDFHDILKIVGGTTITAATTCGAGANATGSANSYYNLGISNPVAIILNGNEICSGVLVTSDLVLTAAHCFDTFRTNGSLTQGTIRVYFNTSTTTLNNVAAIAWGRSPEHDITEPGTYQNVLNDIAWIKVASGVASGFSYSPVNVLANPQTAISATAEKLSMGYGHLNDSDTSTGTSHCVSTYADSNYLTRGDVIPSGAASKFNAQTSTEAYEDYLTVIGPINSSSHSSSATSRGTCSGDSGGPTYVYKNGSWVLAALTQGSNSVLSPQPLINFQTQTSSSGLNSTSNFSTSAAASCNDGYGVYTTVGNYANWISTSDDSPCYGAGETLTTQ